MALLPRLLVGDSSVLLARGRVFEPMRRAFTLYGAGPAFPVLTWTRMNVGLFATRNYIGNRGLHRLEEARCR